MTRNYRLRTIVNIFSLTALGLSFSSQLGLKAWSAECDPMTVWDHAMGMCMPLAMEDMPMKMLMIHGNGFATYLSEAGPRGVSRFAAPHMVMIDAGLTLGSTHYLNLDFMGTAEKWTLPPTGYPELLQIGEHDETGAPFLDAQHPHSSPIMGLTLSDTIRLDTGRNKDYLKLSFAPRGESTDGPIAFMHRQTGMANPDAPLGHHIGQDVGHITSTVIATSLRLGSTVVEASTFNGTEPEPIEVDLPLGAPNSYAARLIAELDPSWTAMISAAYVKEPEHDDPSLPFVARYSASVYSRHSVLGGWQFYNTAIFGLITKYDRAESLMSFGEEFWLHNERASRIFGRIEVLQRTPNELGILAADGDSGRWVTAATLGYTHAIAKIDEGELGLGG